MAGGEHRLGNLPAKPAPGPVTKKTFDVMRTLLPSFSRYSITSARRDQLDDRVESLVDTFVQWIRRRVPVSMGGFERRRRGAERLRALSRTRP
jgi:hypothetical protein